MTPQFLQYILLTPTYINILNVYAFCNTHDITWGTKGDTTAAPLGSVAAPTGPNGAISVAVPDSDHDLNTQYETELRAFAVKYKEEKKKPSEGEKQEDYYKGFRSATVLVWMFCNLALCAAVLSTGGFDRLQETNKQNSPQSQNPASSLMTKRQSGAFGGTGAATDGGAGSGAGTTDSTHATIIDKNSLIYMRVVLYSVAALSLVRWIGALWFLVVRLLRGV